MDAIMAEMAADNATPLVNYKIEIDNWDSGFGDEFTTETIFVPTKAAILAAIDRLRELVDKHYEAKYIDQARPGCCGPEENIKVDGKIKGFIRITAKAED